jgi:hypothetical protein
MQGKYFFGEKIFIFERGIENEKSTARSFGSCMSVSCTRVCG